MSTPGKIKVAVIFGGRGPEHAVSCLGAGNVLRSLDRARYDVVPIGITRDGSWVEVADRPERLAITDGKLPSVEAAADTSGAIIPGPGSAPVLANPPAQIPHLLGEVDVVLAVLHGPYGEDGTIQGLLDMAGVPYVGAGVLASAVSMDKEYMKLVFRARGLPVGPHVVVRGREWAREAAADAGLRDHEHKRKLDEIAELGYPLFVKPARGGSSIGTTKVRDIGQLYEAISAAQRFDDKVLVEAAIDADEIEVSVLEGIDGAPPDTSLPGLLRLGEAEFYDFRTKYLDANISMTIPAPIPAGDLDEIRRLASAAFEAVSCEGLARVDFFYTRDRTIVVNEINTIPGMSPTSYFQKMWEASGMSFPDLVDRLITTALRKPRPGPR